MLTAQESIEHDVLAALDADERADLARLLHRALEGLRSEVALLS